MASFQDGGVVHVDSLFLRTATGYLACSGCSFPEFICLNVLASKLLSLLSLKLLASLLYKYTHNLLVTRGHPCMVL